MYSEELSRVEEIFVYLSQAVAKPNGVPAASAPEREHIDVIIQLLERWPYGQRFPSKYFRRPGPWLIPDDDVLQSLILPG